MQNYCIVQFLGGLNFLWRFSRKVSLTMKLLFILVLGLAYVTDGYAQKTSITLKAKDCTIEEVLHKIELESGFGFFVNSKNLDLKRKVSVSVSDRKSTRLNSSHANISYAVFCLKKKKNTL